jgi:hypothetical protein
MKQLPKDDRHDEKQKTAAVCDQLLQFLTCSS